MLLTLYAQNLASRKPDGLKYSEHLLPSAANPCSPHPRGEPREGGIIQWGDWKSPGLQEGTQGVQ